jgi:hypothetical protein
MVLATRSLVGFRELDAVAFNTIDRTDMLTV